MESGLGNAGIHDGVPCINRHGSVYFLLAQSHPRLQYPILLQIWRIHPSLFILRRDIISRNLTPPNRTR
jgi:hypothetical protein